MVIQTTLLGAGVVSLGILLVFSLGVLSLLKLHRRRFELSIWESLPETMNPSLPLEERFKTIFGLIEKIIKTDEAYVYLVDSEGKTLVQKASKGGPSPEEGEGKILASSHMEGKVSVRLPRSMPFLERDEIPGLIT